MSTSTVHQTSHDQMAEQGAVGAGDSIDQNVNDNAVSQEDTKIICMICTDPIGEDFAKPDCSRCTHKFHIECLGTWMEKSMGILTRCPICGCIFFEMQVTFVDPEDGIYEFKMEADEIKHKDFIKSFYDLWNHIHGNQDLLPGAN